MWNKFMNFNRGVAMPPADSSGRITDPTAMRNLSDGTDAGTPLPAESQVRDQQLRAAAEDLGTIARTLEQRRNERIGDRTRYATRVRQLEADRQVGADHPDLIANRRELAAAEREIERLDERIADAREKRQAIGQILSAIDRWRKQLPAGAKIATVKVDAKLAKNESPAAAVERVRHEIAHAKARRREVEAAPRPSSEVRSLIRREIDELAARGAPSVYPTVEAGLPIAWPTQRPDVMHGYALLRDGTKAPVLHDNPAAGGLDVLALFAWTFKADLLKRLEQELSEAADDGTALSREQRAKKLQQADEQLIELERLDVVLSEEAGVPLRADADPRAVLMVDGPALKEI